MNLPTVTQKLYDTLEAIQNKIEEGHFTIKIDSPFLNSITERGIIKTLFCPPKKRKK